MALSGRGGYNAGMPGLVSAREAAAGAVGGQRPLYDRDLWSWTQEQAAALRRRDLGAIDWENVIEEIESLGGEQKRSWRSHCKNVIAHLLKMEHSRARESLNHWRKEILNWRDQMARGLLDNPGMKGEMTSLLAAAWEDGRRKAIRSLVDHEGDQVGATTKALGRRWRARLPQECPYALEDIAGYDPRVKGAAPDDQIWPAAVAHRMNEELGEDYPVVRHAPFRPSAPRIVSRDLGHGR